MQPHITGMTHLLKRAGRLHIPSYIRGVLRGNLIRHLYVMITSSIQARQCQPQDRRCWMSKPCLSILEHTAVPAAARRAAAHAQMPAAAATAVC